MAKTEENKTEGKVDSDRQARWDAHLAAYEAQNPKKYAAKKEKGEFDTVPVSFH